VNSQVGRGVLDMFSLDGRVAIVSGASSRLGAGIAVALAEAGADVVVAARRTDRLAQTEQAIRDRGRLSLAVRADVTMPEGCSSVVAAAMAEFGRLDILVNNSGAGSAGSATRATPETLRSTSEVNLMCAYWMTHAAARDMQPGSSIVNIASVFALIASYAQQAACAARKAGLVRLSRDLSAKLSGRRGIRVNALAPGCMPRGMPADTPPLLLSDLINRSSPSDRTCHSRELNGAVVFLASPASSHITGTTLVVDGGMSGP
jgi:NAD(P)-dependent dehydrogenase (short-subunit alcohol dehydrogenase family)